MLNFIPLEVSKLRRHLASARVRRLCCECACNCNELANSRKELLILTVTLLYSLQKIERPFLLAVKDTLDDRYTENMENIYKLTIKFILETIAEGYEKNSGES